MMKKVIHNKVINIVITAITIIVASLVVIVSTIPTSNKAEVSAASGHTLVVKKVSTVSIYLTGPSISLINSTNIEDRYLVSEDSEVRLRAVNETRIFTKWNITGSFAYQDGYTETDALIKIFITGDTEISLSRRDPISSDFGTYQYNSFIVDEAESLYVLQRVINAGAPTATTDMSKLIEDYTYLLKVFDEYKVYTTDAERIEFIKNNNLYEKIINGYFLVANNLSLFGHDFTGIADSKEHAFKGVFSGANGEGNSNVYATITTSLESGINYYGLFGYLDEEAVITNASLNISIAISDVAAIDDAIIYAGGVCGYNNNAILHNLEVHTNIGIEAHDAEIYAGGIAGYLLGGINDFNQIKLDCADRSWAINSQSDKNIYAGGIAGKATNGYILGVDIDISNFALIVTNLQTTVGSNSSNLYAGNVYGYLEITKNVVIESIDIHGNNAETIRCILDSGQIYVSSFIGYAKLTQASTNIPQLKLGLVSISNSSVNESSFTARSLGKDSQANLYAGGLFAYIETELDFTVEILSSLKNSITETIIDGKTIYDYHYLFNGNFLITTIQNGKSLTNSYGTSIAGGLVGYGYINLNGTSNDDRTNILISSETSNFKVEATQSQLTSSTGTVTSKDHCIAGLVYGFISKTNTISNIDIYANNAAIKATREIGSTALGDIFAGGFVGHTDGTNFENIKLYLNQSKISLDSLSYSGQTTDTNNNAYCGGFIGYFTNGTLKNIEINGFDSTKNQEVGTTLSLSTIQNTKAGAADYQGENYLGGIVGEIYNVSSVEGLYYIGSDSLTDKIIMQGHENPDSSFCGGIIGFIKNTTTAVGSITIADCFLKNGTVTGYATNKDDSSIYNPDIYLGGIIGASYCSGGVNVTIDKVRVYDSVIETIGNEKIAVHAAGVIGAATWQGGRTYTVNDSYIYNTQIIATSNSTANLTNFREAYAAGICTHSRGVTFNVNRCAVIDSIITATSSKNLAIATGFVYVNYSGSTNTTGCYFNSLTNATGAATSTKYPISNNGSANNTFYISQDSSSRGIEIDLSNDLEVNNSNENFDILSQVASSYTASYGYLNKFYPILVVNNAFSIDYSKTSTKNTAIIEYIKDDADTAAYVDIAFLWINVNENGDPNGLTPNDYATKEAAHDAGWFNLGGIKIYNKDSSFADSQNITNITTNYVNSDLTYQYDKDSATYKNIAYPYNEVESNFYSEKHLDEIIQTNYKVLRAYEVKLYKGMPKLEINFKVLKDIPLLVMKTWVGDDLNTAVTMDNSKTGIGIIETNTTQDEIYKSYTLTYTPNIDFLNDGNKYTFYIGYNLGTSTNHEISCFRITLVPNNKILVGVTYADYTKPLNYYEANLGETVATAYLLAENSITKFLPVVKFSNDPNQNLNSEDTYVDMISYSIPSGNGHTILASGELTVGSESSNSYTLTLTLVDDPTQAITIYYKVSAVYQVAVSVVGANTTYIPYATTSNRFYLKMDIYSGYSSEAVKFTIQIGKTTYDMNSIFENPSIFTVNAIKPDGTVDDNISNFITEGYKSYDIYITIDNYPSDGSVSDQPNIDINAEFYVTYAITFDLSIDTFYPEYTGPKTLTYNIKTGTSYYEYFKDLQTEISTFVKDATLYGYVFTGFYLVENASSNNSYGQSFENISSSTSGLTVLTSNIFYARWAFLIELVEAPGTKILSSFPDSFMQEYYEEDKLNRTIEIPINSNKGYVFTVLKEPGFIGEASIDAYTINKVSDEEVITNIEIEKYHEDMCLYFIPPEKINGYLVIVTSISNSQIIVGEKTASVSDEILPEDGIYTFKYVTNHKNTTDNKSYIYDSGTENPSSNLEMTKDFLLKFKQQTYADGTTLLTERTLVKGTLIEVYYQKYVNEVVTNNVIASYKVENDSTSYVKLSDFTTVNQDQTNKAFKAELFKDFLGSYESVSEVYYFVITPPNGYSSLPDGIIFNYVVEAGYLNQDVNPMDEDPFIKGYRTKEDFAIIDITDELQFTKYESSMQQTMYSVTQSRKTILEKDENRYTFTDNLTYEIATIATSQASLESGVLRIFDDATHNSTIYNSKSLLFDINSLTINLGYNTGQVDIYGKKLESDSWEKVGTINVTSVAYQDYYIKFNNQYRYFMIDNISAKEIRCKNIQIVSNDNGMEYDLDFAEAVLSSTIDDIDTYIFANNIIGDLRHAGKTFMLAVQLTNGTEIIENLDADALTITYVINDTTYTLTPSISYAKGQHTLFYNLSELLSTHSLITITLNLMPKTGLDIYAVQLLEVSNKYKPSNGEVRVTYN